MGFKIYEVLNIVKWPDINWITLTKREKALNPPFSFRF